MSNLSQYRLSIGLFSLGLLWVVSEVVGDGDQPGMLDKTTTSIVHRLDAQDKTSEPDSGPVLAVSQAYTEESSEDSARSTLAEEGAADGAESAATVESSDSGQALPPPDVGTIHQ
jgi:hypothetical protein